MQQENSPAWDNLPPILHTKLKSLNFVNNFSDVSPELIEEALEEVKHLDKNEHSEEVTALLIDIKSNLTKIHQHGTRANTIISSMPEHSRGGSGKIEPTNLNA